MASAYVSVRPYDGYFEVLDATTNKPITDFKFESHHAAQQWANGYNAAMTNGVPNTPKKDESRGFQELIGATVIGVATDAVNEAVLLCERDGKPEAYTVYVEIIGGNIPVVSLNAELLSREAVIGSKGNAYSVALLGDQAIHCTCEGFKWRKHCKHLAQAETERNIR